MLTDCDGRHSFSVDYDDFLADKADYQNLSLLMAAGGRETRPISSACSAGPSR